MNIEITMLEDRPMDIPYLLGRIDIKNEFLLQGAIDFRNEIIPLLKDRLENKLLSDYGERTALLIRQVSPLWTASDWKRETADLVSEVLAGREKNYGMGVWILCSNNSAFPASTDLYPLFDPEIGFNKLEPIIPPYEKITAKITWENNISFDYNNYVEGNDVIEIRIDSPHNCEYAILIAFTKDEPVEFREEAMEFYRNHLVFFCPCGKGKARMIGNWLKE
jgi:hypothetical protein